MKQVWMCEKCGRLCDDQTSAAMCEDTHLPIVSTKAMSWCQGFESRPFPKRIKVTVDLNCAYNYAIYELKQIGPTGV